MGQVSRKRVFEFQFWNVKSNANADKQDFFHDTLL